ncbi:NAD(P)-dependent oxidoreductase [Streptomyces sp. GKU 257-1]|nr:NAD(P)-dependent oxidoreductase [Streptomyces sp. GKU 257-1]
MTTETARHAETVGCAGLGMLGAALAQRLADAGHLNAVWNRTPGCAVGLDTAGVRRAAGPAALMRESTVLVLCVSDSTAVEEVTFGPGGLAEGAGPGKVLVDHSSIGPQETRSLAARLAAETGAHWLDAPVSGGPQGAAAGKLTVLAGGSAEDFDRVRPVLDAYAGRCTLTGPVGAGQATKLCNQIIVGAPPAGRWPRPRCWPPPPTSTPTGCPNTSKAGSPTRGCCTSSSRCSSPGTPAASAPATTCSRTWTPR